MENVNNVVILASCAMVLGIILFIAWYNRKHKNNKSTSPVAEQKDVFEPIVQESPIPGVMPDIPGVVTEEIVVDVYNDDVMIKIDSISRIKTKSREFLMDSEANYTKKEADAILNDLDKAFPAVGLDLSKAPFKYTVQ